MTLQISWLKTQIAFHTVLITKNRNRFKYNMWFIVDNIIQVFPDEVVC